MTLILIAAFVFAILLILLAVSLGRREPNEITIDTVRGGNGTDHRHYTYEQERER